MKLQYNENGKFRICQLTDIHLGEFPFNDKDNQTLNSLEKLFNTIEFDLVIITGDLMWSEEVQDPSLTLGPLYKLLNRFSFPVAVTYGNHDTESVSSRFDIRALEQLLTHPADKYNQHVTGDRQDYTLEIFNGNKLSNVIYVWDSGAYADQVNSDQYAAIEPEQIQWFNTLPYVRNNNHVDLGFIHIPLPEYKEAAKNIITGKQGEKICSPNLNSGLFYSIKRKQNVKALFCGHDHDNNFVSQYNGVNLHYGNVTGYNCYGDLQRGVRIIDLEDTLFETNIKTFK